MDKNFKNWKLTKSLEKELHKEEDRPTWESRNEGVKERVNFDDTIWGFTLAGGAYYDTPLRVTEVKPGSRAARANIKIGDIVTSINDIDTYTLTVQEAHDIILESGFELKLAVAAPDVEETMYFVYQDETEDEIEEARRIYEIQTQHGRKIFREAKTSNDWNFIWPCNKKRDIIYRESNCFMVPSRYEQSHAERILKCQ